MEQPRRTGAASESKGKLGLQKQLKINPQFESAQPQTTQDQVEWFYATRRNHRQRQSRHLAKCGARCVLEAMLQVGRGQSVDAVLADFERLEPETYHACIYHYAALSDDEVGP